ncbi:MAG: hypothetical protein H7833_18505 [Magnetococcus sp. DMHC-1]
MFTPPILDCRSIARFTPGLPHPVTWTREVIRAHPPLDVKYLQALEGTLAEEWNGPADEDAYRDP